ncbi:MAG: hypothetical protein ACXVNF_08300 [Neobacillus sp.]
MEETTIAAVERMTECPGMSLWRLDQWRMKTMKKMFEIPTDMPMKFASADEVHSCRHARWIHQCCNKTLSEC